MKHLFERLKARWWQLTYPFWADEELLLYRQSLLGALGEPRDPLGTESQVRSELTLLVDGVPAPAGRVLASNGNLLVVGCLGSGKTSLLRRAARQQASDAQDSVPLLLNLCTWRGEPPLRFLSEALASVGGPRLAGSLPSLLGEGRLVLLLDDADLALSTCREPVPDSESAVWASFLSEWPAVRYVVACCPSAERAARELFSHAKHAYILPASPPEAEPSQDLMIAIEGAGFLTAALASAASPYQPLADLLRRSADRAGLPTQTLEALSRLALNTLRSPCIGLAELDEQSLNTAHDAEDLGIVASTHPRSTQVCMGTWWRAYFSAVALIRVGHAPDSGSLDCYINDCQAWPGLVLWCNMLQNDEQEVWLRRLLARGDESGLLLALGCIVADEPQEERREIVIDALLQHVAIKRLGSHWESASRLGDMLGARCVSLLLSILGEATALQEAQILALLGEIGGVDAARALAHQGLDRLHDLAMISTDRALLRLGDLAANVLVGRLGDPSGAARERARGLLSRIGPSAIAPLIIQLRSDSETVREAAAQALGEIGALAVPSILAALREEEGTPRAAAESAMQALDDPSAVPYLFEGIRDKNTTVRKSALLALLRVARRGAARHLASALCDPDEEIRVAVLQALDPEVSLLLVDDLVAVLRDPEQRVRVLAMDILTTLAGAAVIPLVTAFRNDNWAASSVATTIIERIGIDAIPPLRRALADPRWQTRLVAANALQWVRHIDVVAALGDGLRDKSARVREAAATSLGRLRFRDGVPGLISALSDRSRQVRQAAARALGEIAAPQATRALVEALFDQDIAVRNQVIVSLSLIGSPAVPALVKSLGEGDWRSRKAAVEALKLIGDMRAAPALQEILADGDWRVKEAAAEALGELGAQSAIQALLALLAEKRDAVRWKAVDALVKIGSPAIPGLLSGLRSPSWAPRWAAATALGRIGEPALPALMAALTSHEEQVRWAAESALSQVGDAAIPLLTSALYDREPRIRQAAIEALSQIGTPAAKATLDEYWMASWTRR